MQRLLPKQSRHRSGTTFLEFAQFGVCCPVLELHAFASGKAFVGEEPAVSAYAHASGTCICR